MKNLLRSSFLAVLFGACTFGHYGKLKPVAGQANNTALILKPIFGENFNSFLFKTNIRIYAKDFSGLLVTKQMEPKTYRVIFTTEMGLKLFDFEFRDTSFILHYCVPQFNRPAFLKTIQHDIEILLMNNLDGKPFANYTDRKNIYSVQRIRFDERYNYYFTEKTSGNLVKIENAKKRIKKIIFTLNDWKDGFPSDIIIQHYDIKLKIELKLLKR